MSAGSGRPPRALTIAGSDPCGGAGLQADLRVFAANGVYGLSAVTALTAQSSLGVVATWPAPAEVVAAQLDAVLDDLGADATKTGMLATAAIVEAVAAILERHRLPNVVVDPVLRSTSGAVLLEPSAVPILVRRLLPLARVVTPNLAEASTLLGRPVDSVAAAEEAARELLALGPQTVVVTGGHQEGDPIDVLADASGVLRLDGKRVGAGAHGTGCAFAAALAARLALGSSPREAAAEAKRWVTRALESAVRLGRGRAFLGF